MRYLNLFAPLIALLLLAFQVYEFTQLDFEQTRVAVKNRYSKKAAEIPLEDPNEELFKQLQELTQTRISIVPKKDDFGRTQLFEATESPSSSRRTAPSRPNRTAPKKP